MPTPLHTEIRDRLEEGATLVEVEREVIEPAPIDEERRAALWLFAWLNTEDAAGTRDGRVPVRIAS
jgi:hypothetical protein